jgi:hypothetical protein
MSSLFNWIEYRIRRKERVKLLLQRHIAFCFDIVKFQFIGMCWYCPHAVLYNLFFSNYIYISTSSKIEKKKADIPGSLSSSLVTVDSDMGRRRRSECEHESLFDHLMAPNTIPIVLSAHLMDNWRAKASNNVFRLLHTENIYIVRKNKIQNK